MPNPVYFRCKSCGGIRMKKAGSNKRRRYVCQRCGTEHTHGHGYDAKQTVVKEGCK
jgi:transposase-like protein